jgi:ABC-type multidrug transport system ATPase subunit
VSGSALAFAEVAGRGLTRQFGRRRALSRVDLTCRAGEIVGLLGPNGAGKSTLIGVLSSLLQPTAGEVRYGGRLAAEIGDALRARIGVLGHDLFLYSDLTARENLTFFGRLYAVAALDARVDRALAEARLTDRANDRVGGFSRGLRQRLALERALLHDPTLVLLDEPFTGLDDESASLLIDRLCTLRQAGAIIVMASHDFESADRLVDRAICLDDGRARELPPGSGTLRDRYRRRGAEAVS